MSGFYFVLENPVLFLLSKVSIIFLPFRVEKTVVVLWKWKKSSDTWSSTERFRSKLLMCGVNLICAIFLFWI